MKLSEVMSNPNIAGGLAQSFAKLPRLVQSRILQHYKLNDISLIHTLRPERIGDVEHDIQYFTNHPDAAAQRFQIDAPANEPEVTQQQKINLPPIDSSKPQAGYNVGDELKYPPTGAFTRRQAS